MLIVLMILGVSSMVSAQFEEGDDCYDDTKSSFGTCEALVNCSHMISTVVSRKPYTHCGFTVHDELVCCVPKNDPDKAPSVKKLLHERLGARISVIKCSEYAKSVNVIEEIKEGPITRTRKMNLCGSKVIGYVTGGVDAHEKEFPHMALLGFANGNNIFWKCSGTLISHEYVLTAAHCVLWSELRKVRLGEHDLAKTNINMVEYDVLRTIIHPDYTNNSNYYDIALAQLNGRVQFDAFKRPACLPTEFKEIENFAIATGWGATSFTAPSKTVLQKVTLDLFPDEECQAAFQVNENINSSQQFCAGSYTDNKDTCSGDSGGPLQVYRMSDYCMYTVIGITSFGETCGLPGQPGVYQRVFAYLDWIENIVW